jgi:protein-S-isoprenylcysteine O-methyltransferase Ste14
MLGQTQKPLVWIFTVAELLLFATTHNIFSLSLRLNAQLNHALCPSPSFSHSYVSPLALLGVALIVPCSILRLVCFRKLGPLFTFDLVVFPTHKLITSGPYQYLRHPSYTGTFFMCIGLALFNLAPGSWAVGCGIVGRSAFSTVLRVLMPTAWIAWWLAVGVIRCRTEDEEMRKKFGAEWEAYASRVKMWMIPGIL